MTDEEKWSAAVAAVTGEYAALSPEVTQQLDVLLEKVARAKQSVHGHAEQVSGREICAACGGECCLTGKYHFSVVDLLAYVSRNEPLFAPRFGSGRCPYLGEDGCLMDPMRRPFNCLTFNCEQLDELLTPVERERFMAAERELRSCYAAIEGFFDNRFMGGLLNNCERDLLHQHLPVLRGKGLRSVE